VRVEPFHLILTFSENNGADHFQQTILISDIAASCDKGLPFSSKNKIHQHGPEQYQ
jgi:hypothetical protein